MPVQLTLNIEKKYIFTFRSLNQSAKNLRAHYKASFKAANSLDQNGQALRVKNMNRETAINDNGR